MNEQQKIEANKSAWGKLSKDHYEKYSELFTNNSIKLNPIVEKELGDIKGKKVLHLQCNTGADSILLAQKGAIVTAVDLVPDNIYYAKKLAKDLKIDDINFIVSDVLELMNVHEGKYDIIITFDGVIGWLPDLDKWGKTISHFLDDHGYFYLHDAHPFIMVFDEEGLPKGDLKVKYPYFDKNADLDTQIGGYASESKQADNYYWGHSISTIVNGLISGNLYITYFYEYDRCVKGMGGSVLDSDGLAFYPMFEEKLPLVLSIKAKKMITHKIVGGNDEN